MEGGDFKEKRESEATWEEKWGMKKEHRRLQRRSEEHLKDHYKKIKNTHLKTLCSTLGISSRMTSQYDTVRAETG